MASIEERTASVSESGDSLSPFSHADEYAVHHSPQSPLSSTLLPDPNNNYHAQEEPEQSACAPWTLGSTDGSLLMALHHKTNGETEEFLTGAAIDPEEVVSAQRSLYQERLFSPTSASVESVLAASCEVMGFDIAEMWLRTGPKTHQLTHSHLRPTTLEDSVRKDLVEVYYGEKSSERTHRLSPALCKRAKEAADVVWVTAHNRTGAEALRGSISNVRTAVAVPVCHETSNTNITILFFSMRRCVGYLCVCENVLY